MVDVINKIAIDVSHIGINLSVVMKNLIRRVYSATLVDN